MQKIYFVRRSFRIDGGAETASHSFLDALSEIAPTRIVSEKWTGSQSQQLVEIKKSGITRKQKYINFVCRVQSLMKRTDGVFHSHEFIPGAQIVRLGDGLHTSFLDRSGMRPSLLSSGFHRVKIGFEKACLGSPCLKKVIVNSNLIASELRRFYGITDSQLIRNIVRDDYKDCTIGSFVHSKKLLFVGSGWERKGLFWAIACLKDLPGFTLDIFGRDRSQSKYQRFVRKMGLNDRVFFNGVVPLAPERYRGYTALIHPAIYEPFPNVAVEALSQGVPVISTPGSGTSDFSVAEGVWTIPTVSGSAIKDAVEDVCAVTEIQRSLYREHILQFDKQYLRRELATLYSDLYPCYLY